MVYPVDNVIHNLNNWACKAREVPALPICFPFRGFWRFSRTKSSFRRAKSSHLNRAELLLPSGHLPGNCGWNSRFLHTDVTPGSYGKLQNLLIKAYTIAHHVWGNTGPLSSFSCSSSISLQTPQTHQDRVLFPAGSGVGGFRFKSLLPVSMFVANSMLLRPWLRKRRRSLAFSWGDSFVTKSWN